MSRSISRFIGAFAELAALARGIYTESFPRQVSFIPWASCKSRLRYCERIHNRSANCPVCEALMIGRSMNLRKLDSLRYTFCDPDFF